MKKIKSSRFCEDKLNEVHITKRRIDEKFDKYHHRMAKETKAGQEKICERLELKMPTLLNVSKRLMAKITEFKKEMKVEEAKMNAEALRKVFSLRNSYNGYIL